MKFLIYITDDDECTDGTHDCDPNAVCTNTDGSFTCTCNSGFTRSGASCTGMVYYLNDNLLIPLYII